MANAQGKEHARCLEYAQQHTIMLLMLLLFFGVLIVPRFFAQVRHLRHKKMDGVIKTVYFSQSNPTLSFVEVVYQENKKEYIVKELLYQHLRVGDHVELYVSQDKKEILFEKPRLIIPSLLLVAYAIIFSLCLYMVISFYTNKK